MSKDKLNDLNSEAHFLVDNFGILPNRAAELLEPDPKAAEDLAAQIMADDREKDALEGLPVPGPDKDPEHIEKSIKDLEKPVVGTDPTND